MPALGPYGSGWQAAGGTRPLTLLIAGYSQPPGVASSPIVPPSIRLDLEADHPRRRSESPVSRQKNMPPG